MKAEVFLLGLMRLSGRKQLRNSLHMTTAARLLNAQNWKSMKLPMVEERWLKMLEFAKMAKLTD